MIRPCVEAFCAAGAAVRLAAAVVATVFFETGGDVTGDESTSAVIAVGDPYLKIYNSNSSLVAGNTSGRATPSSRPSLRQPRGRVTAFDTTWFDAGRTGAGEAHVIAFLTNTPTLHAADVLFV